VRVVINRCFGGFSISLKAAQYMAAKGSKAALAALRQKHFYGDIYGDDRTNPLLVEAVEALGKEADGSVAELKVVEIPDGVDFEIDDYDGMESIHERHRSWG